MRELAVNITDASALGPIEYDYAHDVATATARMGAAPSATKVSSLGGVPVLEQSEIQAARIFDMQFPNSPIPVLSEDAPTLRTPPISRSPQAVATAADFDSMEVV